MDVKELAKKPPMAMPGFTVITPKSVPDGQSETDYDKMIREKQMTACEACEGRRPTYPAPEPQPVPPPTEKKTSKR